MIKKRKHDEIILFTKYNYFDYIHHYGDNYDKQFNNIYLFHFLLFRYFLLKQKLIMHLIIKQIL